MNHPSTSKFVQNGNKPNLCRNFVGHFRWWHRHTFSGKVGNRMAVLSHFLPRLIKNTARASVRTFKEYDAAIVGLVTPMWRNQSSSWKLQITANFLAQFGYWVSRKSILTSSVSAGTQLSGQSVPPTELGSKEFRHGIWEKSWHIHGRTSNCRCGALLPDFGKCLVIKSWHSYRIARKASQSTIARWQWAFDASFFPLHTPGLTLH